MDKTSFTTGVIALAFSKGRTIEMYAKILNGLGVHQGINVREEPQGNWEVTHIASGRIAAPGHFGTEEAALDYVLLLQGKGFDFSLGEEDMKLQQGFREAATEAYKALQVPEEKPYFQPEYLEIGCSPYGEDCAQVGSRGYYERAKKECHAFIAQLKRLHGEPSEGARLMIKSNPHDFGTYYEVAVKITEDTEEAWDYAQKCESEVPEHWDAEAVQELAALLFTPRA